MEHSWFKDFAWKELRELKMIPSFIPKVKKLKSDNEDKKIKFETL